MQNRLMFFAAIFCAAMLEQNAAAQTEYNFIVGKDADNAGIEIPTNVNVGSVFVGSVQIGRSYCCELLNTSPGVGVAFFGTPTGNTGVTFSDIARGGTDPKLTTLASANAARSRICIRPASTILNSSFLFLPLQADSGSVITDARVSCLETTLFGRFNTVVNQLNFLAISNLTGQDNDLTTSETVTGTVVLTNSVTGATAATLPFSVGPNSRLDLDIHTAVGSATFGAVILTHNGPAGSIKAVVDQYRITSTSPFAFQLAGQEKLEPR